MFSNKKILFLSRVRYNKPNVPRNTNKPLLDFPLRPVWAARLAAASLLVLLCSCGDSLEPVAVLPENRVVRVRALAGHLPAETVDDFSQATGIRVELEEYVSGQELVEKLQEDASRWDVVIARESQVGLLRELRLLSPVNLSALPGLKHIDWSFLDLPFDPGNKVSVPYLWGLTVLAFRKDERLPPPSSWSALFDSPPGKVLMPSDLLESFLLARLAQGPAEKVLDEAAIQEACGALVQQSPLVLRYESSALRAASLVRGEAGLAPLDGGDALNASRQDKSIALLAPAQGAPRWMELFAIPRDAHNVEEAYAFINYFFAPAVAAKNASALNLATPNKKAEPLVPQDLRKNPLIYPRSAYLSRCRFCPALTPEIQRALDTTWTAVSQARPPSLPLLEEDLPPTP